MEQLKVLNEQVRISSREVAEMMEVKQHSKLLRKIDSINTTLTEAKNNTSYYWIEGSYKDVSGKVNKEYLCTKKGVKLLIDSCRKTPKLKNIIEFYNSMSGESNEIVLANRFEDSFKECLLNTLDAIDIEVECQKSMFNGKYRIDFYLPEYKLAIEYDEEQHRFNIENDLIRQLEIEKELACKFIRLDYKNNDNYNVGLVMKELMKVA